MSYGQPCKSITVRPSIGPASANAPWRTPASICLREPSESVPVDRVVAAVCALIAYFLAPAPATGFATAWSASRITSVTACGCETMITCEPLISTVLAPALWAIERMTSVPAALSPTATTAHEGMVFQAGDPQASLNAPAATGRCVAAMTADCFSGTSAAKASWNLAGSTMNSGDVSPSFPVGYRRWTSAALRTLSFEFASAPPRVSPFSGAKAATNTTELTFLAVLAALLITAPPYECPTRIVGPSI